MEDFVQFPGVMWPYEIVVVGRGEKRGNVARVNMSDWYLGKKAGI